MRYTHLLFFVVCIMISGCSILSSDNYYEAGPILFISNKSGALQLYSMDEKGKNVQMITKNKSLNVYDAKWSPDGSKIAFTASKNNNDRERELYLINSNGSNLRKIISANININNDNNQRSYLGTYKVAWAPDNNTIAYTRQRLPESLGLSDVFLYDLDKKREKVITDARNKDYSVNGWIDNDRLLGSTTGYTENDSTGALIWESFIGSFDRSEGIFKKINGSKGSTFYSPIYGIERKAIAYSSNVDDDEQNIYLISQNNTVEKLTEGTYRLKKAGAWSPDNNKVVFSATNSGSLKRILVLSLNDKSVEDISPFDMGNILYATSWK